MAQSLNTVFPRVTTRSKERNWAASARILRRIPSVCCRPEDSEGGLRDSLKKAEANVASESAQDHHDNLGTFFSWKTLVCRPSLSRSTIDTVGDEFHLLDASGKVLHVAPTAGALKSWITSAQWGGSPAQVISSSHATWTVPSKPETRDHFQTLYYFNAIG
ncbi:hypothetical protein C8J57DRAFT_1458324 [Mycena rebaudengoi]|nr:hypothetical protein C8J57DRAFT_1458324 [Mycena rebaudengoi]